MTDCICHTELVAFGYEDCDYCDSKAVVSYDDLLADHHSALLESWMAQHGEVIVLSEGEDV